MLQKRRDLLSKRNGGGRNRGKIRKKSKKIPKKRIFSTFFVGFTCKYTNLVYFISVDRNNGTQPNETNQQTKGRKNEDQRHNRQRNGHRQRNRKRERNRQSDQKQQIPF